MQLAQAEKMYKALANRRRLAILFFLDQHGTATVSALAKHLKLSFKSTSKHLQVLKGVDFVESQQVNLEQQYSLVRGGNSFIRHLLSIV